ncbi:MAG: endonuclease MutS2, partial [Bacilli bacterium]
MNQRSLRVLEWPRIREQLARYAVSDLALQQIETLEPSFEHNEVKRRVAETDEAYRLYRKVGNVPLEGLSNVVGYTKRARIGSVLSGMEVSVVLRALIVARDMERFITNVENADANYPQLFALAGRVYVLPQLERQIRTCIDENGEVFDDASPALKNIRHNLRMCERRLKERLDSIVRSSSMLSEQIVTIRNDRYVVPVNHAYRTAFKGIVHDQSSSGQTLFMEPESIVPLNNEMHSLKMEEEREIYRIMSDLTVAIAENASELDNNNTVLGEFDFIFSKAKLARAMNATCPVVTEGQGVRLKRAYHPLLDAKTVVKNDMMLAPDVRTLVITGPNTGGKTVTLKTIGLLAVMTQCGLFITANEESEMGVFTGIGADIGDEQSLEQSLSTFSSHMVHIVEMLGELQPGHLLLFD